MSNTEGKIVYFTHKTTPEADECDCDLCDPKKWEFDFDYCHKCGLKLSQVMMYVCPNIDCPCGLAGVVC